MGLLNTEFPATEKPVRFYNSAALSSVGAFISSSPAEVRATVDCGPEKLVLETSISYPCKRERKVNYAPCRLPSRVRIFAVLNRGTAGFGPRALAVCCERRALGGAWRLVFGRLGRAVKPRRRGDS